MKPSTLEDIARKCNCSITTVSRVLNGNAAKYRISKATAERVMGEISRSGYVPAFTAQSLQRRRSGMVGLLLPSIANPYFADMASHIVTELYRSGYTPILVDTMEDSSRLNESVRALLFRRVEGIIAVPCGDDPSVLEMIAREVPVVLVDRFYEKTSLPYVTTNNYIGAYEMTRLLIDNGHKRIACIQGELDSMPNHERVRGYQKAMEEAGLGEYAEVVGNEFSSQNGYLETKLFLSRKNPPTALFAFSNTIFLGSLKALRESSVDVPGQISIVSFDDNTYMDYLTPTVTRVSQPVESMAKLAAKVLCDRMGRWSEGDSQAVVSTSQIRLAPSIIKGESIAKTL
ncbi:MAG: LacI family DNA-binding transcriptional regulator [Bacteroidales bacterium]|nr:LacI family DNA-binding transcriptional regulator [Bacteroidales bacterium]